ncbi:hypothetical protein BG004_005556, partial [Podila humilis]
MLQGTMENLLHPPAVVSILVLGLTFVFMPQQYKNIILFDFLDDAIPMFASFRAYVLYPMARIFLGWDIPNNSSHGHGYYNNNSRNNGNNNNNNESSSSSGLSFMKGLGVRYLLDEHRNATT